MPGQTTVPGTPAPGQTPVPQTPAPTRPPPPGATPGGYYYDACLCAPDLMCPQHCAIHHYYREPDGGLIFLGFTCIEGFCSPQPTPTAGPPAPTSTPNWPCDYPPTIDDGILHQPCEEWPGWYIEAEAMIPSAMWLVNPWPRSMVGLETRFWYLGAGEVESFSEERALPCNVVYGRVFDDPWYDCGTDVGLVTEPAKVNYQVGVAWRLWTWDDGAIYGMRPVDEASLIVPDREWNGGTQTYTLGGGQMVAHTFETSSWVPDPDQPLPEYCQEHDCTSGIGLGPLWNAECQDRTCPCDERIEGWDTAEPAYLGAPAYRVHGLTWWWPEYTFKYDLYECAVPATECQYWDGFGTAECDLDGDGTNDADTKLVQVCDGWRWRSVVDPRFCAGVMNGEWCMYDLRMLGADPLVASSASIVAGADPDGTRCSRWYDQWPYSIPVPVIELQPVGAEWPQD